MSNYEATKYDFDGQNLTDIQGLNTGLIIPWTDTSVPTGYLECNGAAVSRSTYADLFTIIGTTYGSGDGSTTFGLPNLQDDVVVGRSGTKTLASTGGANTVNQAGNISVNTGNRSLSTPTISSHNHPYTAKRTGPGSARFIGSGSGGNRATNNVAASIGARGGNGGHNHPASATFSGGAKSVLQPYLTLIYIIKT